MKKRRLLSFTICLILVIGLTGCRKNPQHFSSSGGFETNKNINKDSWVMQSSIPETSTTQESVSSQTSAVTSAKPSSSVNNTTWSNNTSNQNSSSGILTSYTEASSVSSSVTSSEIKTSSTDKDYYDTLRPWYNIGFNRQLRGTPLIYAIFMDDDESSWDAASIEAFLSYELDPAVLFLENEAKKWGVSLDLSVRSFGTALNQGYTLKYEGIVNKNLRTSPSTKDVLIKAAEDFGYSSEEELQNNVSASHGGNEIIFMCIFNKDGTCYTRNQITNGYDSLVEEVVFFRRPLNTPQFFVKKGQRVSVVTHEILHAFGAEDFYTSASREKLAEECYPNDIMLWQYENINQNKLGDCVAFSIGWTDIVPEVCYNENWWK